jgi:hypothetical protein
MISPVAIGHWPVPLCIMFSRCNLTAVQVGSPFCAAGSVAVVGGDGAWLFRAALAAAALVSETSSPGFRRAWPTLLVSAEAPVAMPMTPSNPQVAIHVFPPVFMSFLLA